MSTTDWIKILGGALSCALTVGVSHAMETIHLQSTVQQTPLLELYSSEGCSSCPPADRWLSAQTQHKGLWQDFVPVAFHVDYWNYLGWRDIFSDAKFTLRQQSYFTAGHISQVYTPGFILSGEEWRSWRRRNYVPAQARTSVGRLSVDYDGQTAVIHFVPSADSQVNTPTILRAYVSLLGFDLRNDIGAGENRGERLRHDFVVLHLRDAQASTAQGQFQWRIALPMRNDVKKLGLAAWVSRADDPAPLQAVGGYLASAITAP